MRNVDLKYIESLVEDARIGDSNAFASLFAITYEQQYQLAYSYLWSVGYVQDVLFDIYLNALHSMKRLNRPRQFNQWMNRMNIEACEILAEAKDIAPPKGRVNIPPFSLDDAKRLLEYIFFEEGQKENTIPLETLIEYNTYRARRYGLQKGMVVAGILAILVSPFFFIKPAFTVTNDHDAYLEGRIRYDIEVEGYMPVDTMKANVGGQDTPVYQSGRHSYYVLPTNNGTLTVTTRFINRQTITEEVTVTEVDRDVPILVDNRTENNKVYLYVKDMGSSIDYSGIFALDDANQTVAPLSYNGVIGEVIFPYPSTYINVYIPDRAGNVLHLVINGSSVG